jgi:hypothetical protein
LNVKARLHLAVDPVDGGNNQNHSQYSDYYVLENLLKQVASRVYSVNPFVHSALLIASFIESVYW